MSVNPLTHLMGLEDIAELVAAAKRGDWADVAKQVDAFEGRIREAESQGLSPKKAAWFRAKMQEIRAIMAEAGQT